MFHNVQTFLLFYWYSTYSNNLWNKTVFLNLFFRPSLVINQAISLEFQTQVLTFYCSHCSKNDPPILNVSELMLEENIWDTNMHPQMKKKCHYITYKICVHIESALNSIMRNCHNS